MPSRPSPVRCKLGEQDGPCQQHQFFVSSCALFTFAIPRAFLCTHKGLFASSLFVVVVVVVVSLSLPHTLTALLTAFWARRATGLMPASLDIPRELILPPFQPPTAN